jgi:acyl-CoA thioester hydrolase, YbgC/YbaW family
METTLSLIVRPTEIDVNGHVNNAKYLEYLEWGREEWYEAANLHYDTLQRLGVQTVTVNININYRKECFQGDNLTVITRPKSVGRTSFVLEQYIVNEAGELCTDALITSVAMDIETRKGCPVPDPLRRLFE